MSETTECADSSIAGSTGSTEAGDECTLPAFGYPECNYGWVECNSKTFPGRTYYYNVKSLCSTWSRPVSRFVPTPFVRPLNLMSDEDFLDVAPIIVSDIEDDDDDYNNNNNNIIKTEVTEECEDVKPPKISRRDEREKKIYDEVMFKLYHCYEGEWNIVKTEKIEELAPESSMFEPENFCEDSNDNLAVIIPETCYSSESEDESSESLCANWPTDSALSESFGSFCDFTLLHGKGTDTFLSPTAVVSSQTDSSETLKSRSTVLGPQWKIPVNTAKPKILWSNKNTSFDARPGHDCAGIAKGDCDLSSALSCLEVNNFGGSSESVKQENVSDDTILSYEGLGQLEPTSDEEDEEEEVDDKNYINNNFYTLPKLKAIEFSDLLTDPLRDKNRKIPRKRRAPRENDKKIRPKKFIKTVFEMNGIRTVNYDYLTPELPDGVKMSNLSDSGSSTRQDAWQEVWNKETLVKDPPKDETSEITKAVRLTKRPIHDLFDISEPYLSESSSSSSASVKSKGTAIKKRLELHNASKGKESASSESDSSDSSTSSSSSDSSATIKNTNKPIGRFPRGGNKNFKSLSNSSSSLLSGSDKSWRCNGSSDDEDY